MPIAATFDGYVIADPQVEEGAYGRYVRLTLKVRLGREVHYVEARFYGSKIAPLMDYVHAGDYMTMSGSVSGIMPRERKDGLKCCHIYLREAFFTFPPKMGFAPGARLDLSAPRSPDQSRQPKAALDEGANQDDNELLL
jgi:hypothetical protein